MALPNSFFKVAQQAEQHSKKQQSTNNPTSNNNNSGGDATLRPNVLRLLIERKLLEASLSIGKISVTLSNDADQPLIEVITDPPMLISTQLLLLISFRCSFSL